MSGLPDSVAYFLGACVALLPMVNPLTTAPLFISLTEKMPVARQRSQAMKTAILAAIIMLVVLFLGATIMHAFGISISALRIAGGLIVAYIGFRMLFPPAAPAADAHPTDDLAKVDHAFMPLAFPSLVGAGTMAVVMSMATHAADNPTLESKLRGYVLVAAAILTVAIVTWLVLRASSRLTRLLGKQGVDAMTRVMGLLLVCIGVQFLATGVKGFIAE